MKKRSAINSKGSDWYCCANYNTVDPDSSLTKVHEDMNFLVKYKFLKVGGRGVGQNPKVSIYPKSSWPHYHNSYLDWVV